MILIKKNNNIAKFLFATTTNIAYATLFINWVLSPKFCILSELRRSNKSCKKERFYKTTPAGFEPTRDKPNGFQVHRLNHSATVSAFIAAIRSIFYVLKLSIEQLTHDNFLKRKVQQYSYN